MIWIILLFAIKYLRYFIFVSELYNLIFVKYIFRYSRFSTISQRRRTAETLGGGYQGLTRYTKKYQAYTKNHYWRKQNQPIQLEFWKVNKPLKCNWRLWLRILPRAIFFTFSFYFKWNKLNYFNYLKGNKPGIKKTFLEIILMSIRD